MELFIVWACWAQPCSSHRRCSSRPAVGVQADPGAFLHVDSNGVGAGRAELVLGAVRTDGAAGDVVHDSKIYDMVADAHAQATVAGAVAAIDVA
jgi:hypothetical protein